jgi:hypothetical protein
MSFATMDPAELRQIARIGGLTRSATTDMNAFAAQGRDAFAQKFIDRVRAEHPEMSTLEVLRRAAAMRRAYFADLALRSHRARKAKRDAQA